jgi:hypothetical protein
MSQAIEIVIPPAPRGLSKLVKAEWTRMAKMMIAQGLNPADRIDLLEDFIKRVAEEMDLETERQESSFLRSTAIDRRLSIIFNEKLRVRALLFKRARGGG